MKTYQHDHGAVAYNAVWVWQKSVTKIGKWWVCPIPANPFCREGFAVVDDFGNLVLVEEV